ncbi:MAG: TPR repeat protein [Bradymonadia bacterium]|jgi:TPR repeat protein
MKRTLCALPLILLLAACSRNEASQLPPTASNAAVAHATACDAGDPVACYALALIYHIGDDSYQGVGADPAHAQALFTVACDQGEIPEACAEIEER